MRLASVLQGVIQVSLIYIAIFNTEFLLRKPKGHFSSKFTSSYFPGATTPPPVTPSLQLPGEPANFVVSGKTDSTIALAWQPPLVTNGAISQYLIQYKLQGGTLRKC